MTELLGALRDKSALFMSRAFRQSSIQARGLFGVVILAIVWSSLTLGPRPFDIHDNSWLWGDFAQVYTAWCLYMSDPDAWLLQTNTIGYPLSQSVALFDPMPILLVLTKPIAWMFPDGAQYFGYYFALCLILQGGFAYLAIAEALRLWSEPDAKKRLWPTVVQFAGAILIMTAPYTLYRFSGHTALASQWLLVMGIWVALRTRLMTGYLWYLANCGMLFLATGFNPYLAAMTGMTLAAVTIWQINIRNWPHIFARIGALAAIGLFGLWIFGFASGAGVAQAGFGIYSMNVLGPLDSNGSGSLLGIDVLDPTGGQSFEGFAYLGLGAIILIVAAALCLYRREIDRNLPLWAGGSVVMAAVFLALSTRVTLSGAEFQYDAPQFYLDLMSRFRASGRFFWLAAFWLIILSVAILAKRLGPNRSALVLTGLALVQWTDTAGVAVYNNKMIASFQRLDLALEPNAFADQRPEVIRMFPPWQCDPFSTPGGVRNYELTGYFSVENHAVTNNVYAARTTDEQRNYHCDMDARVKELDMPGVYVFSDAIYAAHKANIDAALTCRPHTQFPGAVLCT